MGKDQKMLEGMGWEKAKKCEKGRDGKRSIRDSAKEQHQGTFTKGHH
jgi:hypothetical protein